MAPKYELIDSDLPGLFRVRALRNFGDVYAGKIGGYVAGEYNLSQQGEAWIEKNARVEGNARVIDDACVGGRAQVGGHAQISGHANVTDDARVDGHAKVEDHVWVEGHAWVGWDAQISGHAQIGGHVKIESSTDLLVVGPIGTRAAYLTVCIPDRTVSTGCFRGSIDDFAAEVAADPIGREDYAAIIPAIRAIIANRSQAKEAEEAGQ